jgi:carbon storage regulator
MLIISRKAEQSITLNGNITVKVLGIDGDRVKLGIVAPSEVRVLRSELLEEVRSQNVAAARGSKEALAAVRQALEAQRSTDNPEAIQATNPPSRL